MIQHNVKVFPDLGHTVRIVKVFPDPSSSSSVVVGFCAVCECGWAAQRHYTENTETGKSEAWLHAANDKTAHVKATT